MKKLVRKASATARQKALLPKNNKLINSLILNFNLAERQQIASYIHWWQRAIKAYTQILNCLLASKDSDNRHYKKYASDISETENLLLRYPLG